MKQFKVKIGDEWLMHISMWSATTCKNPLGAELFERTSKTSIMECIENLCINDVITFEPFEPDIKELDLCDILKDAPKGLKLWSVVYGDVKLECVMSGNDNYPIRFSINETLNSVTTSNGCYDAKHQGECTLFPSKDNRDWSTFKLPYKLPVKGELF